MENELTFELQHRYLHDALFHALVHQIMLAARSGPFMVHDIRDAATVAEHIMLAKVKHEKDGV